MKIKSIEPTPSPNTMKVILTEELPAAKAIIINRIRQKAPRLLSWKS